MKKLFSVLAALALIVSMSSCSKEETISQNEGLTPLKFRVSVGKTTRAVSSEINAFTPTDLITVYIKDGTTGANTQLIAGDGTPISSFTMTWDGSVATTVPAVIYMPTSGSVKLVAFAGETAPTFTFDGSNVAITGYTSNAKTSELVYAISDEVTPSTTGVSFIFYHIVSQLIFAVAPGDSNGLDIIINSIGVTGVPVSGNFTGTSSGGTFSGLGYAAYAQSAMEMGSTDNMSSITATDSQSKGRNDEFASVYVLPCAAGSLPGTSTIDISYDIVIKDGTQVAATLIDGAEAHIQFNSFSRTWDAGKRNLYTFKPGDIATLNSIITSVSVIDSWSDDTNTDIEPNTI